MSELTIGRYEIQGELGEGGMGTVYRAYDPTLGREVALKVLQPQLYLQDPQFSLRFEREAKTIAALEHSNVVSLYEFGEDGEWLYIVMRLMEGGALRKRLDAGPLSLEETIAIVRRIGSALDKAHSQGIVHRDLKPANILFDEDGEAFLSDFGIVKAEDATGLKTRTGHALGTPHYMSPEQLEGKEVDGRSDIYSLGIVLYEMLSGSRPYEDESTARIIVMQLTAPVPSIIEANPDLSPELQAVINTAMAKEPAERYGTASEMVGALKGVAAKKAAASAAVATAVQKESLAEAEPAAAISEKPSPAVAEGAKKDGLPGWIWWVGAVAVVLLLIFGIRAMFRGGSDEVAEETADRGEGIAAVISTATATNTAVPPTLAATDEPSTLVAADVLSTSTVIVVSEPTETMTPTPSQSDKVMITHIVQAGETLLGIGQSYDVPVEDIKDANAGEDLDFLVVGQELIVPGGAQPATMPTVATTITAPDEPPPDPALGSIWERPQDQMAMVYVPAGTFSMGSDEGDSDEDPIHDVTLDGFWIDMVEVNNEQFAEFVADTGYTTTAEEMGSGVILTESGDFEATEGADWQHPQGPESALSDLGNHPVVLVSWHDASAYCEWASGLLPTEAQWEYAARGPESLKYPWGEEFDGGKANYCDKRCVFDWKDESVDDRYTQTAPVGSYPAGASWTGALDMAGNVWEWVNDWYDSEYYARSTAENPEGPARSSTKVLRGGSWYNFSFGLRSAYRDFLDPVFRNDHYGFRCVLPGG